VFLRFAAIEKAHPRRDGPNPRKPAETRFDALVKSGADPQVMIDAAKKLATDEGTRGNIGTRFIPQAMTWLNQRWSDHATVVLEQAGGELSIEQAVKMFARIGKWSLHPGPEPGTTGFRASAALLAKYGFGPDGRKLPPQSPQVA